MNIHLEVLQNESHIRTYLFAKLRKMTKVFYSFIKLEHIEMIQILYLALVLFYRKREVTFLAKLIRNCDDIGCLFCMRKT